MRELPPGPGTLNRKSPVKMQISAGRETLEKLRSHVGSGLNPEALLSPRIVLLAESFSPTVTSSVVWLNEQGLDITLRRYQANLTGAGGDRCNRLAVLPGD
jgi:hypothetical protein